MADIFRCTSRRAPPSTPSEYQAASGGSPAGAGEGGNWLIIRRSTGLIAAFADRQSALAVTATDPWGRRRSRGLEAEVRGAPRQTPAEQRR